MTGYDSTCLVKYNIDQDLLTKHANDDVVWVGEVGVVANVTK